MGYLIWSIAICQWSKRCLKRNEQRSLRNCCNIADNPTRKLGHFARKVKHM